MAAPMQTFQLNSHYSVLRRVLHPTRVSQLGAGARQVRREWPRPLYEFVVHDSQAAQSSAEYIYSFVTYHAGDIPFWWSGGPWGTPSTPLLVGFGDGAQTEFFLPNRYVTPGTLSVEVGGAPVSVASVDWAAGLVTLGSPPADQAEIRAQYACVYKCVFAYESVIALSEEQFYAQLFKYEGMTIREMVP